jgi:hypothetical protein
MMDDTKRPPSFLPDEEVQGLVKAEVLPPDGNWSEDAADDARALGRYTPALELVVQGYGLSQAARECGISPRSLQNALYRHPRVYQELKRRREVLRELVHTQALATARALLEGGGVSAGDVTDIIRATKPPAGDPDPPIEIVVDW